MKSNEQTQLLWPELDFYKMQDTLETLHQWIQIVGKIRLKAMPWQNHSWHASLYITSNGFSTLGIPYQGRIFSIDFNFRAHQVNIRCSNTAKIRIDLFARTVADFHDELFDKLNSIGVDIQIHPKPNDI